MEFLDRMIGDISSEAKKAQLEGASDSIGAQDMLDEARGMRGKTMEQVLEQWMTDEILRYGEKILNQVFKGKSKIQKAGSGLMFATGEGVDRSDTPVQWTLSAAMNPSKWSVLLKLDIHYTGKPDVKKKWTIGPDDNPRKVVNERWGAFGGLALT